MKEKKFTKKEAIETAEEFLKEVRELSDKHGVTFNSDTGDIYLSYKKKNPGEGDHWGNVKVGWIGDGTGIVVTEVVKDDEFYKKQALEKLSPKEREALGIKS